MSYTIHALLSISNEGATDEISTECDSWGDVLRGLQDLKPDIGEQWKAITIVHTEDHPSLLGASEQMGEATPRMNDDGSATLLEGTVE